MHAQLKTIDIKVILDQLRIPMEQFDPKYAVTKLEVILNPQEEQKEGTWNYAEAFLTHELNRKDTRYLHTN